jgi:UDP-N-acetylmuramoyl-tripeptide--D-alanyl-D-alanine ligase
MMKKIAAKEIQKITEAEIINKDLLKRRRISGVSTDSRTATRNDLFFAIKGEKFDAHQFIDDVVRRDVAAVVVHREWADRNDLYFRTFPCAFVVVPDTTIAFGELARIYRRKFDIPVIAVAGSNGKTTTKEMVTAVLRMKYDVLATEGNLNNHIGVPQTLFRLGSEHDVAVVELGTNHFGELKYLCEIAEPTHGLITNIGKEHLEFFGDEEGVAKEETELYRYLNDHDGFVFVNNDDRHLSTEAEKMHHTLTYGTHSGADVRARKIDVNELGQSRFLVTWSKKDVEIAVRLSVPGMHNVLNAAAACAVGLKLKVKPKKIADALKKFSSASKRMEVLSHNGVIIINDTYNSNPDSVVAALKTLQSFNTSGRKIAVLADMKELGETSKREHTNIGVVASEMKFDHLFTFGQFSKYTNEAFGHSSARHYDAKEDLIADLRGLLKAGDVVLIKGSRGMKMEEVVHAVIGAPAERQAKDSH